MAGPKVSIIKRFHCIPLAKIQCRRNQSGRHNYTYEEARGPRAGVSSFRIRSGCDATLNDFVPDWYHLVFVSCKMKAFHRTVHGITCTLAIVLLSTLHTSAGKATLCKVLHGVLSRCMYIMQ